MNFEEENNEKAVDKFLTSDLTSIICKSYKDYLIYQLIDLKIIFGQTSFILELIHSKTTYQMIKLKNYF